MRRCSSFRAFRWTSRSFISKGDRSCSCSRSSSPWKLRPPTPKSPRSGSETSGATTATSAISSACASPVSSSPCDPVDFLAGSTIFVSASAMYSSFSSKVTVTTRQPHFRSSRRLNVAEPVSGHSMLYSSPRTSSMTSTGLPLKFPSPISSKTWFRGMIMRCGPSTSMISSCISMTMSARMPASWKPSSAGGMPLATWGMLVMRRRSERRWFCWLMLEPVTSSYTRRLMPQPCTLSISRFSSTRRAVKRWYIMA
mmetsp:Transcript_15996/g.41379  ORF Transcript_15996/g.41379 Transcript_15996/m.41379 type:complete len:254 (+) Transcript_15996:191-952(+)